MGRVLEIRPDEIVLEEGRRTPDDDTLYVDCTANGLKKLDSVPIFQGNRITLQSVRICQQVFSAALIAHVETVYDSDEAKNEICIPIPHPDEPVDYVRILGKGLQSAVRWYSDPCIIDWMIAARLHWGLDTRELPSDAVERNEAIEKIKAISKTASSKLFSLLQGSSEEGQAKALL